MSNTRIERDSMGELQVPAEALYGAQTQRAVNNFPISHQRMPAQFIRALILAKAAAAKANVELKQLSEAQGKAIVDAAQGLLEGDFMQHFPVDIFQTGSGTSSNMNANEVIATLASRLLGEPVNPNDHVNCGQSSNDIIPTTIHVSAALVLHEQTLPALLHLVQVIEHKAEEVHRFVKTGRTHLMDAMPVRMSQVLNGWAQQLKANIGHLQDLLPSLQALAQGGTAVGTGINAHPEFAARFSQQLSSLTHVQFTPGKNLFALIGSQDTAVAVSGQLKTTAVSLMKIANDLRWMNSGPLAGLGEIELEGLQPGSSIMPGKVNQPGDPGSHRHGCRTSHRQRHGDYHRRPVRQLRTQRDAADHCPEPARQPGVAGQLQPPAGRQGHRQLQGQRSQAQGSAVAQSDPGDRTQPDHRLPKGRRNRQEGLSTRPSGD